LPARTGAWLLDRNRPLRIEEGAPTRTASGDSTAPRHRERTNRKELLAKISDAEQRFLTAIVCAHRFVYPDKAVTVPIVAQATGFSQTVIAKAYDVCSAAKASSRSAPGSTRHRVHGARPGR
jgi:hypothetical protein